MTSPVDPSNPSADASPTEPASTGRRPAPDVRTGDERGAAAGRHRRARVTAAPAKPPAAAASRSSTSPSAVAVLVAIAGVAFAVGRTTAPAAASPDGDHRARGGRFFVNGKAPTPASSQGGQGGPGNGNGRFGLGAAPDDRGHGLLDHRRLDHDQDSRREHDHDGLD